MILLQVKPTRAGSSIGVKVAYGVADSLKKATTIVSEVFFILSLFRYLTKNLVDYNQRVVLQILTIIPTC